MLETKVKGRYKGTFDAILSKIIGNFNIISKIKTIVQDEINIVSFGDLSLYDILLIASEKVFKDDFKLYVDGDSKLNILLPLVGESKLDLVFGQNIISSSFSINNEGSSSNITAIGDSSFVSGSIIRLIEPESGLSGYFIVEKDTHNFSDVYTMTLSIKERKFDV